MEKAIEVLKAKGSSAPGGGRALGEHPSGGPIVVRDGRYGAYVSHGKVNATIPKDMSAGDVTLEDAIRFIEEKGGPDKKLTKRAPAKKAAAKKPAAKSAAAKSVATKPKKKIDDSDEAPFADAKPRKAVAKKAPAKKAAVKKAPAKKAVGK